MLTEMKRRAKEQGATVREIGQLQKTAVEDTLKGMDINPISLQLAASQLTTGNQDIGYRRMGLHRMPYGPDASDPAKVSAGTLELLGQKEIVSRHGELDLPDAKIASEEVWTHGGEAMEDAVDAVKGGVRIVIMNPRSLTVLKWARSSRKKPNGCCGRAWMTWSGFWSGLTQT